MTTIVYKEEMITSNSGPRNVQTKTFTVKISPSSGANRGVGGGGRGTGGSKTQRPSTRGGSPKPDIMFNVKSKPGKPPSSFPPHYDPRVFTITAYLPHEGGKRLKVTSIFTEAVFEAPAPVGFVQLFFNQMVGLQVVLV